MKGKIISGWFHLPVMLVGLALFTCAARAGENFVKYSDSDVSTYLAPGTSPSHLYNSSAGEVKYFLLGDKDPIRVTPLRANEKATNSHSEALTPMDADFIAARSPQALDSFVAQYAPADLAFVAVQNLAKPMIDARNWASARAVFEKYAAKFPAKSADFSKIISIIDAPGGEVGVYNLGAGVNSNVGEYAPVVSSNGKKLIFARDCGVCAGGEEVYISSLNDSGYWSPATKFGHPLNSRSNEIPLSLSADGNTLAVYGNYTGTLGRGDIFHLDKTPQGWSNLQPYPAPLNSEYFESNATYSPDGAAILFVSERPGGVGEFHPKGIFHRGDYEGNTDIYAFVPDSAGSGSVVNLGRVINTPYTEYSPFIHPDGKTLYFSSNGHPGLGGLDVFKSTRLRSDAWTEWSEPVNLGKEINTANNDWGYQFDARGDKAYFAVSGRMDGYGGSDIFTVGLPGKAQPFGVVTVTGTVTDPAGNFLAADLRWNDLIAAKEVGRATSDPQNGEYIIHLPRGGKYAYYAEKPGYMGQSENVDLAEELGYREFVMDIVLHPVTAPLIHQEPQLVAVINMNNIFFDFDKSTLRSESKLELDRWVRMLNENPSVALEIYGHTDSVGSDAYNLGLSERRASVVRDYLVNNGINAARLKAKGFGERQPVQSNRTYEGRQFNRRVEVRIFNK